MKILLFVCTLWTSMYIDPTHGQAKWTKIKIDYLRPSFTQYKITCKGNCGVEKMELRTKNGGQIMIYGNILNTTDSSYSVFCKGETFNNRRQKCDMSKGDIQYKDHPRKVIYIVMLVIQQSSDAILRVKINGFEKAELIPISGVQGQVKWEEIKVGRLNTSYTEFKITCKSNCDVKKMKVLYKEGGDIYLYGSILKTKDSHYTPFCKGETDQRTEQICDMSQGEIEYKDYKRREVYITLVKLRESSDVTLRVQMQGFDKVEKIPSSGAQWPVKWEEIKVGSLTPSYTEYRFKCKNVPCAVQNIEVLFKEGGEMYLYGSILKTKDSYYTPFCKGETVNNRKQICDMSKGDIDYKDYQRDEIYITLVVFQKSFDVELRVKINGFEKAEKIPSSGAQWPVKWEEIKVGRLKPSYTDYKFTCKDVPCDVQNIEILFKEGGNANLYGSILKTKNSSYTNFCKGEMDSKRKQVCNMSKGEIDYKDYPRKEVYITMVALKKIFDVKLRVRINGFEKAEEIPSSGVQGQVKWTEIKIGSLKPSYTEYKFTCKYLCHVNDMELLHKNGGRIWIYGSIKKTKDSVYSDFCLGEKNGQSKQICDMSKGDIKYEDYPRQEVYVTMIVFKASSDVKLRVNMIGFEKAEKIPSQG